jgi:hypothetical protein
MVFMSIQHEVSLTEGKGDLQGNEYQTGGLAFTKLAARLPQGYGSFAGESFTGRFTELSLACDFNKPC